MNSIGMLRRMFALLAVLLIALALGIWFVISLASQLSVHSDRQTTATEFALTLTRLANLIVIPGDLDSEVDGVKGDSLAQLLAMGDVQSKALAANPSRGWFKSVGSVELAAGANEVSGYWRSIKSALADLNTSALTDKNENADRLISSAALDAVDRAFDPVFNGVTSETLSVPLLQILSEVKAELASLRFLSSLPVNNLFVQPFTNSFERFTQAVHTLQMRAQGDDGGSLIGYESTVELQAFVDQTVLLKPAALANQSDVTELKPASFNNVQGQIQNAITRNEITRRALDNAIYQYRRAILGALACLCAALLLSAVVTWRIWYLKRDSKRLGDDDLGDMVVQISAIADGNFTVNVQPLAGSGMLAQQSRSIANAVNHTEKMFRSLVQVSCGVSDRTALLADRQQQITRTLLDASSCQVDQLIEQIKSLRQSADEVKELSDSKVVEYQDTAMTVESIRTAAVTSNTCLAGISSQVELGSSRISRAVETVAELSLMVERMKASAEKASLKALNTSIQISAYSDGGDLETSPQFIDDVLKVSRNLSTSATDAQRLVDGLKSDLQATSLAMSSCTESIGGSADSSLLAIQLTDTLMSGLEEVSAERLQLIEALTNSGKNLSIATETLSACVEKDDSAEQHAELLQTAQDIQELVGNFQESLSVYRLDRDDIPRG